jgi:DNA-binding IclR family transcriptional regulator
MHIESLRKVQRILHDMLEAGLVEKQGGGHYRLQLALLTFLNEARPSVRQEMEKRVWLEQKKRSQSKTK